MLFTRDIPKTEGYTKAECKSIQKYFSGKYYVKEKKQCGDINIRQINI